MMPVYRGCRAPGDLAQCAGGGSTLRPTRQLYCRWQLAAGAWAGTADAPLRVAHERYDAFGPFGEFAHMGESA